MSLLRQLIKEAITETIAEKVAKRLKIDFSKVDYTLDALVKGMNVELEHRDVTKGNLILTAKIALAHLRERPDYYERLEKYVEIDKKKKEINIVP